MIRLFHRRMGQGPPLVILHGLFGSSDNLNTVARGLSDTFEVLLVDQRDHGRSPHTDAIDYDRMAIDLRDLLDSEGIDKAVIVGHSMGGKTAMRSAQLFPERVPKLVVIDIGPREYGVNNHAHIVEALLTSDLAHKHARADVQAHLARYVPEPGVQQFLMKSLYWAEPDKLAWRFNVPLIANDIQAILAAIGPEVVRTPTLFIRGGQSDYIPREDLPQIHEQFPNSRVETIPYAGHWVHAQAPDEVVDLIRDFA
ncbi:MAG: alpha/beta fold hydrolase [Flavobacteriales bacterium]|nr:alpha/beta fold hydrolase [Flavobacteriales bacterium]